MAATRLAMAFVAAAALRPAAGETRWQTARELKQGVENIVGNQVLLMQARFANLSSYSGVASLPCTVTDGPFCNANDPAFSAGNPFLVKEAQHSNIDGSCGQVDRDACGYPLALPITGRRVYGNPYGRRESCRAPGVKFCCGEYQFAAQSKVDTLAAQGCIRENDPSICKMNVDPDCKMAMLSRFACCPPR